MRKANRSLPIAFCLILIGSMIMAAITTPVYASTNVVNRTGVSGVYASASLKEDIKASIKKHNAVQFMGTVDLNSIDQLSNSSRSTLSSLGNDSNRTQNVFAIPYLTPFGEEKYKELKQKAKSGELPATTNVTTPPMGASSLEELFENKNANRRDVVDP